MLTKRKLINFEKKIAQLFQEKKIKYPIHLSGGNEDQLIKIFQGIQKTDYVFSTHRNHYHYLLHTGDTVGLKYRLLGLVGHGYVKAICNEFVKVGDLLSGTEESLITPTIHQAGSMHTIDVEHNFYSSAIVGGCIAIACGVAWALKKKKSKNKVWCFIGDAATDSGWFPEALRYAAANELPITYVIEDNNRSVCTTKKQRWGKEVKFAEFDNFPPYTIVYSYKPKYPHVGIGKDVQF